MEKQDYENLCQWLISGHTGLSSRTMAATMFGLKNRPGDQSHPHDPSDFARCVLFLEAVPGTKEKLPMMKTLGCPWIGLVDRWDELEAMYREDKASQLYNAMKEIGC